jgi:hypothetical protein
MRFLGLATGLAACCLAATATQAGVADRPASARCPLDGYCCPYGLGQWEGRPHRYVHRDGAETSSAASAAPLPFLVDPTRAVVGSQAPRHEFYDDVGDSNFDRPAYVEPAAEPQDAEEVPANHPACQGEQLCETEPTCELPTDEGAALRGLEESLADWHHSAGQWVVEQINAEADGLEETAAEELDWAAIASQREGHEVGAQARPDGGEGRERQGEEDADDWFRPRRGDREALPPVRPPQGEDDDDTYQGPYHRWEGGSRRESVPADPWRANEAAYEPGRLRQWCGQTWEALRSAAHDIGKRLEQLSEEVTAGPSSSPDKAGEPESPRIHTARPPLPDYFLPAFGSPWDGEL